MVVLFSFCINLLMLTAPIYMLQIYDRVLTSRSYDTLLFLTAIAGLAFLTLAALEVVRSVTVIRIGSWLDACLSGEVLTFGIIQSLNREAVPSTQGLRDLASVRSFLIGPALFPIFDALWLPIFIAVIFLLHPMLGWLSLAGAILLLALALLNEYLTRPGIEEAGRVNQKAMEHADSSTRNSDAIESMGMMRDLVGRWQVANAKVIDLQSRAAVAGSVVHAIVRFLRLGLQVAVLGLGAFLLLRGELSPGALIAGAILMDRALAPIDQAISSWRTALATRGAYQRIKLMFANMKPRSFAMPLTNPRGDISVENMSYGVAQEPGLILHSFNFTLPAGSCLGLIGPTAAGKSTLARLLVGTLEPRFGHVRLDGMDVTKWESDDRGQHIGYLPQDVELFDATIRENIARLGDSDPEAVIAAAKLAQVHDIIARLPNGYDTEIGTRGALLSIGQQQRIGLARAVYGNPRLVVLDEPAAYLDQDGETALVGTLRRLKERNVTIVVVAHRPNLLHLTDYILVLKDGAIHSMGPRDEVLNEISRPRFVTQTHTTNA